MPLAKGLSTTYPKTLSMSSLGITATVKKGLVIHARVIRKFINAHAFYYTAITAIILIACGRRIMANMPAFQASDESSILSARTI
jgi:hypothetical protein